MSLRMQTLFAFTVLWSCCLGFTCLDYNNNPVDWYYAYKLPQIPDSTDPKVKEGLAHFYLDVNTPKWKLSPYTMGQPQQAMYETLNSLYKTKEIDIMYLMYSDQNPPGESTKGKGHTKGVVAFNKTSGFWIVHSVPYFPARKSEGYSWPSTASRYGQSFLCVSFKYSTLGQISKQLLFNQPNIYDNYVSPSIYKDFPILNDVIKGANPPGTSVVSQLTSLKGRQFISFAKSGEFGHDLYDNLVAPFLQKDLLVETWRNGQGTKLPSNCTAKYKVMNTNKITISPLSFKSTVDHSKWAVSFSSKNEKMTEFWTCIGDINRMMSQFKTGGGTLCFQNSSVWQAFRTSVDDYDSCPSLSSSDIDGNTGSSTGSNLNLLLMFILLLLLCDVQCTLMMYGSF